MSIEKLLESKQDEMLQTLKELVARKSVKSAPEENAPFGAGVASALEYALGEGRRLGFECENMEGYIGVVRQSGGAERLGILTHMDVVPEGDAATWTYPPFEMHIENGRLIGRGVGDDKGPFVSALYALWAVRESGAKFKRSVEILAGCDEESGWDDIEYYKKHASLPDMAFSPDGEFPVVNAERAIVHAHITAEYPKAGGARVTHVYAGEIPNAVPDTAKARVCGIGADDLQKAIASAEKNTSARFSFAEENGELCITAQGVASHGSRPDLGCNALTALLELLTALPLSQNEAARAIKALCGGFGHGVFGGEGIGIASNSAAMGTTTASLDMLRLDESGFIATVDIRHNETYTKEQIIESINAKTGLKASIKHYSDAHYVSEQSELVQTLLKVYGENSGREAYCLKIGGGTYARAIDNAVCFGTRFPEEPDTAHMADESVKLEDFFTCARIIANAILELACEA